MSHLSVRTIVSLVLIAACARSGTAASKPDSTTAAATTGSAGGTLATPAMPHDSISDRADHGRITGDPSAKLWVVMASDFQCPYCKQWHDSSFAKLMKDYVNTGKVRLAFLNMPLGMHPNAVPAAEAAMCASVQNKFWPMHEALFATQQQWETAQNPVPQFEALATKTGVNTAQWNDCMARHLTLPLIQADRDRARAAGVNSTPTFFVDNKTLAGADADITGAIDAALAGKKAP